MTVDEDTCVTPPEQLLMERTKPSVDEKEPALVPPKLVGAVPRKGAATKPLAVAPFPFTVTV